MSEITVKLVENQPKLQTGTLFVYVDGKEYHFDENSCSLEGTICFDDELNRQTDKYCLGTIKVWPRDFPKDRKQETLKAIDDYVKAVADEWSKKAATKPPRRKGKLMTRKERRRSLRISNSTENGLQSQEHAYLIRTYK